MQAPGGGGVVLNTHLSFVPPWNVAQLHRLGKGVRARREAVIAMGDLSVGARRRRG